LNNSIEVKLYAMNTNSSTVGIRPVPLGSHFQHGGHLGAAPALNIPIAAKASMFFLICALPVIVHIDALVNYVIPFYWPDMAISPLLNWL